MEIRVSLSGEGPEAAGLNGLAGVGLLRGEFIFRARGEYLSVPGALVQLQDYLRRACSAFSEGPVWYRLADLWSDEAKTLAGSPTEPEEPNPILGLRGVRRGLTYRAALNAELGAVTEIAQRHGNLHLLLPFVQDADEFAAVAAEAANHGWPNRIGSMVEIPSAVLDARRLVDAGATNLLVGLNDLTSLMLGRERSEPGLKLHRAVWWAIDHLANTLPAGVEWGIGGSLSPALLDRARQAGAPYVTIHYAELPKLLGTDAKLLEDREHVRNVKAKTRAAKEAQAGRAHGPHDEGVR